MKKLAKKENICFLIAVLCVFCSVYALNSMTPLIVDDYGFQYGVKGEKLASFYDILVSEISKYQTHTGRVLLHTFAQTFLWLGKPYFNIANSIIYTMTTILVYRIITEKKSTILYIFIAIMLWLFLPVFGQSCLWLIGACNYLWGSFFVLLFGWPLVQAYRGRNFSNLFGIIMFLLGLFAGACNENTSGGAILWIVGVMIAMHKKGRDKNSIWIFGGLCGVLIGYVFLLAAPGNWGRTEVVLAASISNPIVRYGASFAYAMVNYSELWILILVECVLLMWLYRSQKIEELKVSGFYFFISLAVNFVMTFAGSYPARAMTGATIFLIIAVGKGGAPLIQQNRDSYHYYRLVLGGLLAFSLLLYGMAMGDIAASNVVRQDREIQAERMRETIPEGARHLETPEIRPLSPYNPQYGLEDIFINENHWTNQIYAKEYGIDTIKMNGNAYRTWGQALILITKGEYRNE